jgi:WD40 repeat protein
VNSRADRFAVQVLDSSDGKQVGGIPALRNANIFSALAFSPDGDKIAGAASPQFQGQSGAWVWEARSGKVLFALEHGSQACWDVQFSPDGRQLAVGWHDGAVTVFDLPGNRPVFTADAHPRGLTVIAFRPDGKHLGSGGEDGSIRIWDAASGACLRQVTGHARRVSSVAYSTDGQRMVSASDDKTLKLWAPQTGRELLTLAGAVSPIRMLAFTADGRRLVSTQGQGRGIIFYDGTPWGQPPAPLPRLE